MSVSARIVDNLIGMNAACYCYGIDRTIIETSIIAASPNPDMASLLAEREHYFASTAVFLSQGQRAAMVEQIKAIETVQDMPAYQAEIFTREGSQVQAQTQTQTKGVFMGYDFHITAYGPRLIEINTNAGGGFIVGAIEKALSLNEDNTEAKIGDMFTQEWQLSGRQGRPKTIAIVDEAPTEQFHYPDMLLAKDSLSGQGYTVIIANAHDLKFDGTVLTLGDTVIDLVYNRLTDFALTEPQNAGLREALIHDAVVVTPSPRHHALYADKRNLVLLSDMDRLKGWGVSSALRKTLEQIPKTITVTPDNAERLWASRRAYFFKPNSGFGSRGTYKGAKLTTKVWKHITKGGYIAQKFIAPPIRAVMRDTGNIALKFDVRVYSYNGSPLLFAARVYQGQTTNLRTEGGGLAPVLVQDETPHRFPC